MPIEFPLLKADFEHIAPLTLTAILLALLTSHLIKSFIERKIDQISHREHQKYEVAFEMMRYQNQRATVGYQVWINKVFDANVDLFGRLSTLAQHLRAIETEPLLLEGASRDELERYLHTTYGESEDLRNILSFWHSNRIDTLSEIEKYLRPIRSERIRVATRNVEEGFEANQLFLSQKVLDLTSELNRRTRDFLEKGKIDALTSAHVTDALGMIRGEIIRSLSDDHIPVGRSSLLQENPRPRSRLRSLFPRNKNEPGVTVHDGLSIGSR